MSEDDEDEEDEDEDGGVDEARKEKRKSKGADKPKVLVNGAPVVESSAARKEGELRGCGQDERKKELQSLCIVDIVPFLSLAT
jgi:hypothetical protein